jgi:hypothetical protein
LSHENLTRAGLHNGSLDKLEVEGRHLSRRTPDLMKLLVGLSGGHTVTTKCEKAD